MNSFERAKQMCLNVLQKRIKADLKTAEHLQSKGLYSEAEDLRCKASVLTKAHEEIQNNVVDKPREIDLSAMERHG